MIKVIDTFTDDRKSTVHQIAVATGMSSPLAEQVYDQVIKLKRTVSVGFDPYLTTILSNNTDLSNDQIEKVYAYLTYNQVVDARIEFSNMRAQIDGQVHEQSRLMMKSDELRDKLRIAYFLIQEQQRIIDSFVESQKAAACRELDALANECFGD